VYSDWRLGRVGKKVDSALYGRSAPRALPIGKGENTQRPSVGPYRQGERLASARRKETVQEWKAHTDGQGL